MCVPIGTECCSLSVITCSIGSFGRAERGDGGGTIISEHCRIIEGRFLYLKSIIQLYFTKTSTFTRQENNINELLKEILKRIKCEYFNWIKTTRKYLDCTKLTYNNIEKLQTILLYYPSVCVWPGEPGGWDEE